MPAATDEIKLPAYVRFFSPAMSDFLDGEFTREDRETEMSVALMLARAAEAKDHTMGDHLRGIYRYTFALARAMGLQATEADELAKASMLHDIGKLMVPDRILQKPGPLTKEEWAVIRRHPEEGVKILGASPAFSLAREVVRWHHEKWDGSGYPDGLKSDRIPVYVAIVTVADVYDALTSFRPYKIAWPAEQAAKELRRLRGRQFHPEVVDCFLTLLSQGHFTDVDLHGVPR